MKNAMEKIYLDHRRQISEADSAPHRNERVGVPVEKRNIMRKDNDAAEEEEENKQKKKNRKRRERKKRKEGEKERNDVCKNVLRMRRV